MVNVRIYGDSCILVQELEQTFCKYIPNNFKRSNVDLNLNYKNSQKKSEREVYLGQMFGQCILRKHHVNGIRAFIRLTDSVAQKTKQTNKKENQKKKKKQ